MAEYEVTCVNKQPRDNPYDGIDYIGVETSQGIEKLTVPQVVEFIDSGEHRFYVSKAGKRVYLETGISPHNNKYVKTEDDGEPLNNLLSLPECG